MADFADIEYGVRRYDELKGERVVPKPTLVMAEDYIDYLKRLSVTRDTYPIRAELVHRAGPGSPWTRLTSEDAEQIKNEAWDGLDRAMEPVLTEAAKQLFRHPTGGTR